MYLTTRLCLYIHKLYILYIYIYDISMKYIFCLQLDNTTNNCAEFTAFRWYPVANMAELTPIKVYEYYEPGE